MSQGQPDPGQFLLWAGRLQGAASEISKQLDGPSAEEFKAKLDEMMMGLLDLSPDSEEIGPIVLQFVKTYPEANNWLQRRDRDYAKAFGPKPASASPARTTTAAQQELLTDARGQAGQPEQQGSAPQRQNPGPDNTRGQVAVARPENKKRRSAEQGTHLFKEVFTAFLAAAIIGSTLYIALRTFGLVGQPKKIHDATNLLTIMLGTSGLVIGYYFGRVPGDARAAQATTRADAAISDSEDLKARTRSVAYQIDDVLDEGTQAITRGGDLTPSMSQLRTLRNNLRDLT